jgi:hypothetical protein
MSPQLIYNSILRIIIDAIKLRSGVPFESENYKALLNRIAGPFGPTLIEMLDFILSKNKLSDPMLLQADLIVMHYKFMKGGYKLEAFTRPVTQEEPKERPQSASREIVESKSLEGWQKDDMIRKIKSEKTKQATSTKVPEKVSQKWGPAIKENVPVAQQKRLTPREFSKMVGGSGEEEVI